MGRTAELTLIEQRLGDCATVTLTGAAGAGKTRLALEAARHASSGRVVRFVDLAALRVAERVPAAIAAALDARASRDVDFIGAIVAAVRRRSVLLVLDNCEHLIGAAAGIAAALVARCPTLTVLATSRIPLRIRGETVIPVQPLPSPDAMTLFCDRARNVAPGFELTAVNTAALSEICSRLDGLPLAIELAASWTAVMSPGELLRLLSSRFDVLVGGGSEAGERQRTVRAAVDWSYNLLSPEARALFRRLSVFRGSFTSDAVEAVWGADAPGPELTTTLAALCETSMVAAESSASGATRYRLPETLRGYGADRLREDAGEERAIRDRHLMYLVELAERSFAQRMHGRAVSVVDVLEPYRADVRLALDWAATTDPDLQLQLAGTLAEELRWSLFNVPETRRVLAEALARSTELSGQRARALVAAGYMALVSEDERAAPEFVEEACALYQRLGDRPGEAWAHLALGHVAWMQDDLITSRYHLSQSRTMFIEDGDAFGANRALLRHGIAGALAEDVALETLEQLTAAADTSDSLGDAFGGGLARTALGWALMKHGRAADARAVLQEAVRGLHAVNEPAVLFAVEALAVHHADSMGDAMRLMGYARALRQQRGLGPLPGPAVMQREERALEQRARTVLGSDGATQAEAEGRTMPSDEAVALALDLGGQPVVAGRRGSEALETRG
ncbi:MAG TPA: hypothetical protein VF155_09050 [Candidatus Dormibacteraeota bacterium]